MDNVVDLGCAILKSVLLLLAGRIGTYECLFVSTVVTIMVQLTYIYIRT